MATIYEILDNPKEGYYYFHCSKCGWAARYPCYYAPNSSTALKQLRKPWTCYCDKPYRTARCGMQLKLDFLED